MNIFSIIEKLGEVHTDNAQSQTGHTRRESLFRMGNIGKDMAKVAVPAALWAAIPLKGNARAASTITDVLNFALTLEYLESTFYAQGLSSGVIPSADLAIFNQINKHEASHVTLLQNTITTLGGTPVSSPSFDFTAKGAFNPFAVYADFLALSQGFEDTGVRAYKGQAGNLVSNNEILTVALQIHSVEARHASQVRRLRNKNGFDSSAKGWITGNNRGTMPAATQPVYDGTIPESNKTQGGVDLSTAFPGMSSNAISEAFDEPLTQSETLAIASLFIK